MKNQNSDIKGNLFYMYDKLTKLEKIIATYVLEDENKAQLLTITELAERCGVGEATISRFCKKIGYAGYNEFKLALATSSITHSSTSSTESIILGDKSLAANDSYRSTINIINRTFRLLNQTDINLAVDLIQKSNKISCMGQGSSLVMAMELWSRFSMLTNKIDCVQDFVYQAINASLLKENDLIIYFSYSGSTAESIEVLKEAKKNGTKIILLTGHKKSPATKYADVILLSGAEESPINQGAVTTRISFLVLIDVLYNEYYNRDTEANEAILEKSLKATHRRML